MGGEVDVAPACRRLRPEHAVFGAAVVGYELGGAHDGEVPEPRIRNLDGRMERRHRVHHRLHGIVAVAAGQVPAQAERELRLDHRHVEVARRQLRAALVELALPQASGERDRQRRYASGPPRWWPQSSSRPAARRRGARAPPAPRSPRRSCLGGTPRAVRRSGDGRSRPSRWPVLPRRSSCQS